MTADELLADLSQRGVKLNVDGQQLRIRAPKGILTSELRELLTRRKPELLSLLRQKNIAAGARTPIESIPRDGDLPLSLAQQRLWFSSQLTGKSGVYNVPAALRLDGPLDIAALEQSLTEIARRHEALRTTFPLVNRSPLQVIAGAQTVALAVMDLQQLPEDEQEASVQRLMVEEANYPFDLATGPLWRVTLLQLSKESYVLLLIMHHIVTDNWSTAVFMRELSALYTAFCKGAPSPLPDLPCQYVDFAYAQRQWLTGEFLETLRSYWQQQLGGQIAGLELPTDRPRPRVNTYRGAYQSFLQPPNLTDALKTLSRQEGATLYMTLLAVFKTLLFRYSGQEDIIVCSPVPGRNQVETERLIGFFNNITVLRTDLSGNPSFKELLGRVHRVALGALAHQDLPFQNLVEFPNLARTPLSRTMFVLQKHMSQPLKLPGITVRSMDVDNRTIDCDLSLSLVEGTAGLRGTFGFNTDLFDAATIKQMLTHFQTLLESIVADPNQPISQDSLFSAEKRAHAQVAGKHVELDPLSPNSKPAQRTLPESDTAKPTGEKTKIAPRDTLEHNLTKIWEQVLGIQPIGITDDFFELGGHSLLAVHLFSQITQMLDKNIPLTTLFAAPTVEQLADILRQEGWSAPWSSLIAIQPSGSKTPFFCASALASSVLSYTGLARHLGAEQPFYGLEPLGLAEEKAPHTRLEDMAAHYIKEIRTFRPSGPYFLGGLAFGGLVAFEMAQQLTAQGEKVVLVILDTVWPPLTLDTMKKPQKNYPFLARRPLRYYVRRSRFYLQKRQLPHVLKIKLKGVFSQGNTDANGMPSHIQHVMEVHRKARLNYVAKVYPGRIILLQSSLGAQRSSEQTWSELADGGVECYKIPGEHVHMLEEPHVQVVAAKLRVCLEQAGMDVSGS